MARREGNGWETLVGLVAMAAILVGCAAARRAKVPPGQANDACSSPSMSVDGRYVAFASSATNLVAGDTNEKADIFVRDRATGETVRVSLGAGGTQADGDSWGPSVSEDGRFVAFASSADNLVPGDTNRASDVFLRDLESQETIRVSVDELGRAATGDSDAPAVSAAGSVVAFSSFGRLAASDRDDDEDVYARDVANGTTRQISISTSGTAGNGWSGEPAITPDGEFVVFSSSARNLLPGDGGEVTDPWHIEILMRDRAQGRTDGVSSLGAPRRSRGESGYPSVSRDASRVAFNSKAAMTPVDLDGVWDVFVVDRPELTVYAISPQTTDGTYSAEPGLSADGSTVAFISNTPLVPGDSNGTFDVFVYEIERGTTSRASVAVGGGDPDSDSAGPPSLSGDGRLVAFESSATNLVPGDENDASDIFVHDRSTGTTERVSLPSGVH